MLYALLAVDLRCWSTLVFVLARNLVKLWVEQRQAAPFARFRAKLVGALLAMTIVPAVLVLLSGSEIIRSIGGALVQRAGRPAAGAAQEIASHYYQDHQEATANAVAPAGAHAAGRRTSPPATSRSSLRSSRRS